jgi:hypothetical protein
MNERIRLLAEQATELDYTTFDSIIIKQLNTINLIAKSSPS